MPRKIITRQTIDSEEYYTPSELMVNNIFPWWESTTTLMSKIKSEKGMELFKPIIVLGKTNRRYKIKGENILAVLALADNGQLEL